MTGLILRSASSLFLVLSGMFLNFCVIPGRILSFSHFFIWHLLCNSSFEDLKNAELRNRETQIELALERSRTQSMLMKHSDELNITSRVFHEQLDLLGIESEFSYLYTTD